MPADISPALPAVTAVTVRQLPPGVVTSLKERAWKRRRSMEAELRDILTAASGLPTPTESNLRMHYAGALKLLEECSPHVPEEVRESIVRCFGDACSHHGYRARRMLDRIVIEVADG